MILILSRRGSVMPPSTQSFVQDSVYTIDNVEFVYNFIIISDRIEVSKTFWNFENNGFKIVLRKLNVLT